MNTVDGWSEISRFSDPACPCTICGHIHDPEDGHCDAHANAGQGRCPCPGVDRFREAEAHLWALLVWFGGPHDNPYVQRDLNLAARYVSTHLADEDMTTRHRAITAALNKASAGRIGPPTA